jgi:Tetratricopeptide repeat
MTLPGICASTGATGSATTTRIRRKPRTTSPPRYAEARDLDQDNLAYRRRVLSGDHPQTLRSADRLAGDLRLLGEVQAARDLDQDTLERFRRLLGVDHSQTIRTANSLGEDLRLLGEAGNGPVTCAGRPVRPPDAAPSETSRTVAGRLDAEVRGVDRFVDRVAG